MATVPVACSDFLTVIVTGCLRPALTSWLTSEVRVAENRPCTGGESLAKAMTAFLLFCAALVGIAE